MIRQQRLRSQHISSGFGLVEVLMAALLIMMVMMSVSRTLILGMATNRHMGERIGIESEILNDIEVIQGIDALANKDTAAGCSNPAQYLAEQIALKNPEQPGGKWQRAFDFTDPNILVVTYSFNRPETPARIEKRIAEINPSLQAECQ
jgi:hypothetical protein